MIMSELRNGWLKLIGGNMVLKLLYECVCVCDVCDINNKFNFLFIKVTTKSKRAINQVVKVDYHKTQHCQPIQPL